jgi:hypothetical protein
MHSRGFTPGYSKSVHTALFQWELIPSKFFLKQSEIPRRFGSVIRSAMSKVINVTINIYCTTENMNKDTLGGLVEGYIPAYRQAGVPFRY